MSIAHPSFMPNPVHVPYWSLLCFPRFQLFVISHQSCQHCLTHLWTAFLIIYQDPCYHTQPFLFTVCPSIAVFCIVVHVCYCCCMAWSMLCTDTVPLWWLKIAMKNRPYIPSQFFATGILSSSFISYALVSNIMITLSCGFIKSSKYLSGAYQLNLSFSSTSPPFYLALIFLLVWCCDWPGSCLSLSECHHDCCSCLHSHLLYYVFMLSKTTSSVGMLCDFYITFYIVAFVCLHLPSWYFYS